MKRKIKLIACILILSTLFVNGQDKSFDPPKKVNLIIIEKKDSALLFLLQYAKQLQDFGFAIEKIDKDLLSLSTEFKSYKFGGIAVLKINAFSRQNGEIARLEIRGKIEVSDPNGGQVPFDACNCGLIGDARKNAFKEMMKTLSNFPFDKIEFLNK